MTRLLVIAIALVVAWVWAYRQVRRMFARSRSDEVRSVLRFIEMLRQGARGPGPAARRSTDARAPGGEGASSHLVRCPACGVHVPESGLTAGVCSHCRRNDGPGQR